MRIIPMNDHSRKFLSELGALLFTGLNSSRVTHKFRKAADRAGLEGFKLHSLRRRFASALIAAGVDIYTVSKLLGHADLKTTMVYAKMGLGTMQAAVNTLQQRYALPMPAVVVGSSSPETRADPE